MTEDRVIVSRSQANKAGKVFRECDEGAAECRQAIAIAERWRAQHAAPTAAVFDRLKTEADVLSGAVATYRLKRMKSIVRKLERSVTDLRLGALDDIGGCRLIVSDIEQMRVAIADLRQSLELKGGHGEKDYIGHPQSSGYRSYHFIAKEHGEDGKSNYRVEVQVRTKLQHCWATTVELAGEIYDNEYKSPQVAADAVGVDKERLEFFVIFSSLFALEEGMPPVEGYDVDRSALIGRLQSLSCSHQIIGDLQLVCDGILRVSGPQDSRACFFLLLFSKEEQDLRIEPYREEELQRALDAYAAYEQEAVDVDDPDLNVVLVYARDEKSLAVAYPNYVGQVAEFVNRVKCYLEENDRTSLGHCP